MSVELDEDLYEDFGSPGAKCCEMCPEWPDCDPAECAAWCAEVQIFKESK